MLEADSRKINGNAGAFRAYAKPDIHFDLSTIEMILPSKERQIKGKTALRPPRKETGQPECTKGWQLERIARLSFFRLVH
jgi:hypothetical protein